MNNYSLKDFSKSMTVLEFWLATFSSHILIPPPFLTLSGMSCAYILQMSKSRLKQGRKREDFSSMPRVDNDE